jgi:hypothetical protein
MKLDRSDYLNFAKAGLIVAALMGLAFLISVRLPSLDQFTRDIVGLLVFFPGFLLFMPMIHNVHDYWEGYIYLGALVNWIFYTWGTWAFMEKIRRGRQQRRSMGAAEVAPPDRLPPDQ